MQKTEKRINDLIKLVNDENAFFDEGIYQSIRKLIIDIKEDIDDKYNIFDIWYQDGCVFPYEIDIKIDGEEKTVSFNDVDELLSKIRLLD